MNNPCKNCPDRVIGCHAKCEKHAAWKADHDAQMARRREITQDIETHIQELIHMQKRRR